MLRPLGLRSLAMSPDGVGLEELERLRLVRLDVQTESDLESKGGHLQLGVVSDCFPSFSSLPPTSLPYTLYISQV
jgi:hypothetical protein